MMKVSAFMRSVAHVEGNKSPARKRRCQSSYRYARRNEAKGYRTEAKLQGVRWP